MPQVREAVRQEVSEAQGEGLVLPAMGRTRVGRALPVSRKEAPGVGCREVHHAQARQVLRREGSSSQCRSGRGALALSGQNGQQAHGCLPVHVLQALARGPQQIRRNMTWKDTEAWWVYLVRCRDNSLYCGITRTLAHRVHQHNLGLGAKYTRSRKPVGLVLSKKCSSLREAMSAECSIKKLSKGSKERLVQTGSVIEEGV
jgi:putative endonuclease